MKTETPEFNKWLSEQPIEADCEKHPGVKRQLSVEDTRYQNSNRIDDPAWWEPQYRPCAECQEEKFKQRMRAWSVPDAVLHCRFDNWAPRTESDKQHLEDAKLWATNIQKGFLVLLGPVGTGKTHLAVASMRQFGHGCLFIKQSTLLRSLRATYRDDKAKDPIKTCQEAKFLTLDEMGLSGGGKDEAPMLHEILDYRYSHKQPTVLTSNMSWDELRSELGERLGDRMREAAYKVLTFSGPSHRADRRDGYFADNLPQQEAF